MKRPGMQGGSVRQVLAAALIVLGTVTGALVGCNLVLGIEEQPLRSDSEDARGGDAAYARPIIELCTKDEDCIAPNACLTPHCDTTIGACTYALCEAKDRTCAMGACDTTTYACSDPQSYGFRAGGYDVSGVTLGCADAPNHCVASAFPFVFIGTRDDVVALRTDELVGSTPSRVGVKGVDVKPQQLVASGRRLWILGALQGQTPPYSLPIASIEIPSDPTVTELVAQTALLSYPFPNVAAHPAPNGALFVVYPEPAQGFPTALVSAPIGEDASFGVANADGAGGFDGDVLSVAGTLTMYRSAAAPAGTMLVGASGGRLIVSREGERVSLIAGAGTLGAAMQSESILTPPLMPLAMPQVAEGPDGVVAVTAPIRADSATPSCECRSQHRLQWLFPNAAATTTDANQFVDYTAYSNPQADGGACHVCTNGYPSLPSLASWIDKRTMITASPDEQTRALTDVRLLSREVLGDRSKRRAVTKPTDTPSGNFATDRVALTASNGIGYLVLSDSQGNDVSLSIFDSRCDAR